MSDKYIFKSERLGFRNWLASDLDEFSKINSDASVMEHFPSPLDKNETESFINRLQEHYLKHRYNYFATEILDTGELIGFIGFGYQEYEADFNPSTDIGWRLKKSIWGKGFATEGAKRCLEFAFEELNLKNIVSVCTKNNIGSENVMKKIGMIKKGEFKHPKLINFPEHEVCLLYEIENNK